MRTDDKKDVVWTTLTEYQDPKGSYPALGRTKGPQNYADNGSSLLELIVFTENYKLLCKQVNSTP